MDKLDVIDYLIVNRDQLIPKLKELDEQRNNLINTPGVSKKDVYDQFKYARESIIMDFLMSKITNDNYLIQTIITNMDIDKYIASEEPDADHLPSINESNLRISDKS